MKELFADESTPIFPIQYRQTSIHRSNLRPKYSRSNFCIISIITVVYLIQQLICYYSYDLTIRLVHDNFMHADVEVCNILYYLSVVISMTLINVKFANISARSLLYLSLLLAGVGASIALAILSFSTIGYNSATNFDDFPKVIRVFIGIYTVLVVLLSSFADSVASVASFCYVLESVPPGYSSNLPTSLFLIVSVFGINITKIIPFDD